MEKEMNVRSGEKVEHKNKVGVVIKPVGAGLVRIRWDDGSLDDVHAYELKLLGRHD